ncbi:MAG: hypothetical protein ABJF01_01265 [bacterium]
MPTTDTHDQTPHATEDRREAARIQPWFAMMGASLLPALVSFYLPDTFRLPMYVATGALYAAACVMLYRQTNRGSGSHDR